MDKGRISCCPQGLASIEGDVLTILAGKQKETNMKNLAEVKAARTELIHFHTFTLFESMSKVGRKEERMRREKIEVYQGEELRDFQTLV